MPDTTQTLQVILDLTQYIFAEETKAKFSDLFAHLEQTKEAAEEFYAAANEELTKAASLAMDILAGAMQYSGDDARSLDMPEDEFLSMCKSEADLALKVRREALSHEVLEQ